MFPVIIHGLLAALLALQSPVAVPEKPANSETAHAAKQGSAATNQTESAQKEEMDLGTKLLRVRRIFVDSFGEDAVAKQIQAMVISSLTDSKRFIVTENKEKADAILKGSGLEKSTQEFHANKEGTAAGGVGGSFSGGTGAVVGHAVAIEDSSASTQTVHDARIALRLVDKDGDVIWATTQESKGAKYKGASADVAEKVVEQLLRDVEKLEKKPATSSTPK